ncbi:MAG TPA: 3'-5' exonuclease [Stellaceae bacterium]|jgi:DNA polymerase-3 subunit epsilon|nr:3'-5' exonuclease [Stellaceae bacterium]
MTVNGRILFLDTETTGLDSARHRIVEIAIVDEDGRVLIDTLVNPGRAIPEDARRIHGISDQMVRSAPTLASLWPTIQVILSGSHVVICNAAYDRAFLPRRLADAARVSCVMLMFAKAYSRGGGTWQKLDVAARHCGHTWQGAAHRALADAQACRSVWRWLVARGHG